MKIGQYKSKKSLVWVLFLLFNNRDIRKLEGEKKLREEHMGI